MTAGDLESMMERVSNRAIDRNDQSKEIAAKEVILTGLADSENDMELAFTKLKVFDPQLTRWCIEKVQRFVNPDAEGFKTLKVVLKKKSSAERLNEAIEAEKDVTWARRGLTYAQRQKVINVQKNINRLNANRPENCSFLWVMKMTAGHASAEKAPNPDYREDMETETGQNVEIEKAKEGLNNLEEAIKESGPGPSGSGKNGSTKAKKVLKPGAKPAYKKPIVSKMTPEEREQLRRDLADHSEEDENDSNHGHNTRQQKKVSAPPK